MKDSTRGAIVVMLSSILWAILFAYLFRIPVPFGGYIGPFGKISSYDMSVGTVLLSVFVAWVFYGIFGGFFILPALGAVTGEKIGRKYAGFNIKNRIIVLWSFGVAVIPVFGLSILDYIIGPW